MNSFVNRSAETYITLASGRPNKHGVRDGMHQMRLAEAGTPRNEKRVVASASSVGHGSRSGIGKLIRWSNNEVVKGEFGVQRLPQLMFSRRSEPR